MILIFWLDKPLTHLERISRDIVQANMDKVWANLEYIESTYQQFFLKANRIQSNRVCLGDLTGSFLKFSDTYDRRSGSGSLTFFQLL